MVARGAVAGGVVWWVSGVFCIALVLLLMFAAGEDGAAARGLPRLVCHGEGNVGAEVAAVVVLGRIVSGVAPGG